MNTKFLKHLAFALTLSASSLSSHAFDKENALFDVNYTKVERLIKTVFSQPTTTRGRQTPSATGRAGATAPAAIETIIKESMIISKRLLNR